MNGRRQKIWRIAIPAIGVSSAVIVLGAAVVAPRPAIVKVAAQSAADAPEGVVPFTDEQVKKYGIQMGVAGPGMLHTYITLPGEVRLNADRVARVVLPVTGFAEEVTKNLGDTVRAGETMAVFKSRDLAEARAAYLDAQARADSARETLKREKALYEQKISPQQDLLNAERDASETGIAMRSAEQQLRALGYKNADIDSMGKESSGVSARYVLQSPLNGSVIEKHITLGELVNAGSTTYVVADLSDVWADFTVTQQDLASVRVGQHVEVEAKSKNGRVKAPITYLGPIISPDTRTALARAVLDNTGGAWVPGQFVTGKIETDSDNVPLLIPQTAVQTVDGMTSVFVRAGAGFEVRPVAVGRTSGDSAEVLSGLNAGETYATANTIVLKAQLGKAKAGHEEE